LLAGGAAATEHQTLLLTGLAFRRRVLDGGGRAVSVSSQNELVAAEVRKEWFELENHPTGPGLAEIFRQGA
jgi:hypothetical protein